jgi:peptidoglycan/xylan/chitin deacetylase (PgdA/CDA1 family)
MSTIDLGIALFAGLLIVVPVAWLIWAVAQEYGTRRVPCLLYHQLQPAGRPTDEIDPVYVCYADRFSEQMGYLRSAGYTTLTLDDLMAARDDPRRLPDKPVLITFDDGFASNYDLAFPVLRRNGQRATIFMTPDRTSHNFRNFAHLDRPLDDAQLAELSAAGIDIQSHGLTHRFMTELSDAELRHELGAPRDMLQKVTGRPIRYLAIPGGAYDGRVRRAAREVGYAAVFCMRKGSAGLKGDPFRLPRMVVSRDMTLEEFRSILTPAGWLRGRIVSVAQEAISRMLGMRRTDALRNFLYSSPLAPLLRPRRLAFVLAAICLLTVLTTMLVVLGSWK